MINNQYQPQMMNPTVINNEQEELNTQNKSRSKIKTTINTNRMRMNPTVIKNSSEQEELNQIAIQDQNNDQP